jgi:NAD-dependent deacetylase
MFPSRNCPANIEYQPSVYVNITGTLKPHSSVLVKKNIKKVFLYMKRYRYTQPSPRAPKAFFFTGAGLSADSGVPTFFGSNGAYGRFSNPEEVVSARTLKSNPGFLNRFIDDMRVGLGGVEPNDAHHAIARIGSDYGSSFVHITQNIDDLVERAGYAESIHVHGFLTRMRHLAYPKIRVDIGYTRYWDGDPTLAPPGGFQFRGKDGARFRPDVVLFEEPAPLYEIMLKEVSDLRSDDIAIVIGTRGEVVRIGFMLAAKKCRKVLVNLHPSDALPSEFFHTVMLSRAVDAIGNVERLVREQLGPPTHPKMAE